MNARILLNAATRGAFACALALASAAPVLAAESAPIFVDQGRNWTPTARAQFYVQDQGSQIMLLSWLEALKQPDGSPFLADSLARYGYLPNPANSNGLPIGFTDAKGDNGQFAGMTCAACHTRQISAEGKEYRIDGGPAIVDFQGFLADLDAAVAKILGDETSFKAFAEAVLGSAHSRGAAALRENVQAWYLRYHTLIARALPTQTPWGLGRLDAVGMIFNRLTGLDIGPPPSYLIPDNIKVADAPVRYPFLWNAPKQDKTQWPGFANNGNDILGLSRNLGEVYGVFGVFEPTKQGFHLLGIDYLHNNSANFDGLNALEGMVKQIGAPKWPWAIDRELAARGKAIYDRPTSDGGCKDCHGIRPGETRFLEVATWATTPLQDVGTDTREYDVLSWTAQTGVLEGAEIYPLTSPLKETDQAFNVLATSVLGSIIQNYVPLTAAEQEARGSKAKPVPLSPNLLELKGAFNLPAAKKQGEQTAAATTQYVYEARVLEGIWAAAPYLHNGSVPTLAELLKPASERAGQFKVGPAYDKVNIGLAVEQPQSDAVRTTTDCDDRNSGDSRCGHEFGVSLAPEDKKALLEYLKAL
jgi:hypothetical protein